MIDVVTSVSRNHERVNRHIRRGRRRRVRDHGPHGIVQVWRGLIFA